MGNRLCSKRSFGAVLITTFNWWGYKILILWYTFVIPFLLHLTVHRKTMTNLNFTVLFGLWSESKTRQSFSSNAVYNTRTKVPGNFETYSSQRRRHVPFKQSSTKSIEIQNVHVSLDDENAAGRDFEEADQLFDHQVALLKNTEKTFRLKREHPTKQCYPWNNSKTRQQN